MRDALISLKIEENAASKAEIELSGVIPGSVIGSDIKKEIIVLGLTPDSFIKEYAAENLTLATCVVLLQSIARTSMNLWK